MVDPRSADSGDPRIRSRLRWGRGERALDLLAPHGAFSSGQLDPGTLLLLERLAERPPRRFLDWGCGYGLLGLGAARSCPGAEGVLLDRDLLAVEFARRNAALNGLEALRILGSVGFASLPADEAPFDLILCNFPARAGEPALERFLREGAARLVPGGEVRMVVITPLEPALERCSDRAGLSPCKVAATASHAVWTLRPDARARTLAAPPPPGGASSLTEYLRDVVSVTPPWTGETLRIERPMDFGEEVSYWEQGLPLLLAALEEAGPLRPARPDDAPRVLVAPGGYGVLPAIARARDPGAEVVAWERDLLGAAFIRALGARAPGSFTVIEAPGLLAAGDLGRFQRILGEVSSWLGPRATLAELTDLRARLAPGGAALLLGHSKRWREFLRDAAAALGLEKVASRAPYALYRLQAPTSPGS